MGEGLVVRHATASEWKKRHSARLLGLEMALCFPTKWSAVILIANPASWLTTNLVIRPRIAASVLKLMAIG